MFIGILLFLGGAFVLKNQPLQYAGGGVFAFSLLLIALFRGRKKKGVIGKAAGGLGGLYGIVNYMSDILSYSRIFGLGIATAVIGMVANIIAVMLFTMPIIGYPLGILAALVLHAFNLGMNLLGCYVHNARLQYVEFYGKFYEGGGRVFTPLGAVKKYYVIKP
jgi:V/A-type H+-transporting ATPase subunit I